MQMSWSVLINDYTQACHFTITVQTLGRSTTWEVMPRIRWATIKPLGSKEVVVTITLLIDELFIYHRSNPCFLRGGIVIWTYECVVVVVVDAFCRRLDFVQHIQRQKVYFRCPLHEEK